MSNTVIPLAQRQSDYQAAESRAKDIGEIWLQAKAAHRMTTEVDTAMDDAQRQLLRAKRRLEAAQRKQKNTA